MTRDEDMLRLAAEVAALPVEWHDAGTLGTRALNAIAGHLQSRDVGFSVETGAGRSTLLFSRGSDRHVAFTELEGGVVDAVTSSPLFRSDTVTFEIGPSQRTLLGYAFHRPIDVALLDGPHAYPFPELEYWAVYPHIPAGGLLIVDDVHIRSIGNLFSFLRADDMWHLEEVCDTTAFFSRTEAIGVEPFGEGWWTQAYNSRPSLKYVRDLPTRQRPRALAHVLYRSLSPGMQRRLAPLVAPARRVRR